MILKSIGKKKEEAFVKWLYDYLMQDFKYGDMPYVWLRWISAKPHNKKHIIKSFLDNADLIKQRKNGNYLIHQIISLPKDLPAPRNKQRECLYFLAEKWLKQTYSNHLAFFVVHEDKEHYHAHIMLSANQVQSRVKPRLSSWKFNWNRAEFELYQAVKFPELWTHLRYSRYLKITNEVVQNLLKEADSKNIELILNCGRKPVLKWKRYRLMKISVTKTNEERIKEVCLDLFTKSHSLVELQNNLKKWGFEYYNSRGKVWVMDLKLKAELEGKYKNKSEKLTKDKYSFRFETLGLAGDLANILEVENVKEARKRELRKVRNLNWKIKALRPF